MFVLELYSGSKPEILHNSEAAKRSNASLVPLVSSLEKLSALQAAREAFAAEI